MKVTVCRFFVSEFGWRGVITPRFSLDLEEVELGDVKLLANSNNSHEPNRRFEFITFSQDSKRY